MFPNKPKYHQILPFFWFLFVFGCYLTLKSRTIEWVKKSSLQYPSEGSAASSPGLFPFSKGKPWERGWGVEILDIIGTERGSSSESRLCLIWIQLFQRCHYGHVKFAYTVLGLFLWRSQLGLAWLLSCFLMMFSLWYHEKAGWLDLNMTIAKDVETSFTFANKSFLFMFPANKAYSKRHCVYYWVIVALGRIEEHLRSYSRMRRYFFRA